MLYLFICLLFIFFSLHFFPTALDPFAQQTLPSIYIAGIKPGSALDIEMNEI